MTSDVEGRKMSATAIEEACRARLSKQIPQDLHLNPETLQNLPRDVTGIPESCGLLSKRDIELTNLDATAIRDSIASGKMTSVGAVTAFGKRAAIAHQLVCCLVDYFLDEAIERAKELDEYFTRTGKVVGPLHGVPISIKVGLRFSLRIGSYVNERSL
jgi:amidase